MKGNGSRGAHLRYYKLRVQFLRNDTLRLCWPGVQAVSSLRCRTATVLKNNMGCAMADYTGYCDEYSRIFNLLEQSAKRCPAFGTLQMQPWTLQRSAPCTCTLQYLP